MSGRTELLAYLTAALGTVVGLFVLQQWYGSYLDVSYHDSFADRPRNAELLALRAEEAQKLSGLDAAMKEIADRGRGADPRIAPKPSSDLSAMSGWIRRPGFGPYTPRSPEPTAVPAQEPVPAAVPEGAAQEPGVEGGEGAVPSDTQQPAAAPTAPAEPPAAVEAPAGAAEGGAVAPQHKPVPGVTVEAAGQVPAPTKRPAAVEGTAAPAAVPLQKPAPGAQQ